MLLLYLLLSCIISTVSGDGLLLLYRPKDITDECAFSKHLRFDVSFGMGMSDTITLVFRTLSDIDYECIVEVVASAPEYLLVVVRYPTTIASNCAVNRDAVTVLKKWRCVRLCDLIYREVYSPYFIFTVKERIRFLFKSNSSINSDIDANFYQITITSARLSPKRGCYRRNETICTVDSVNYCFTTGVVCDGINNCGVDDWFDEKRSRCTLPVERLGYAPVVAVVAALLFLFIAGGHALFRCLPSRAQSFFIFNENEDNRLCIDPVLEPSGSNPDIGPFKRTSIIPVFSSISSESESVEAIELQNQNEDKYKENDRDIEVLKTEDIELDEVKESFPEKPKPKIKNAVKNMTSKFHDRLRSVTRYTSEHKS